MAAARAAAAFAESGLDSAQYEHDESYDDLELPGFPYGPDGCADVARDELPGLNLRNLLVLGFFSGFLGGLLTGGCRFCR